MAISLLTSDAQCAVLDALEVDAAQEAMLFARRVRHLAELVDLARLEEGASGVEQFIELELAGTLRWGQTRAARQTLTALRLTEVLTCTLAMLSEGNLFVHQAEVLLDETKACTEQVAVAVERRVLSELADLGPRDAHRLIARTVLAVEAEMDAALTTERMAKARRGRRVWVRPEADAMASIGVNLTAEQLPRWQADFETLVAAQRRADLAGGVVRTQDQRRADIWAELPTRFLQLLLQCQRQPAGGEPPPRQLEVLLGERLDAPVIINVHIPVSTLLETDHRAGFVEGYGQVSAEQVRFMLPTAGLRRLWVHADTGAPIKIDQTVHPPEADPGRARERLRSLLTPVVVTDRAEGRHDPTARLAGLIGVRDQECSGPGCSVAARRCDLDHEVRYPDGPTAAWNLTARSRRCHRAKHSGWTAMRRPDGGTVWHSPLGRDYRRPGFWQAHPRVVDDAQLAAPKVRRHDDAEALPDPRELTVDDLKEPAWVSHLPNGPVPPPAGSAAPPAGPGGPPPAEPGATPPAAAGGPPPF